MDIIDYDPEIMHIFSRDVLKKIINHDGRLGSYVTGRHCKNY